MIDESYNQRKLYKIFSQMKFFIVDNIEITYEYKNISFDLIYHCYLDQKSKKFYVLKTNHYSQSIDTMIQFIIDDTIQECQYKRDKLDKYYRKLLSDYSKNQLEQNIINDNNEIKLTWEININDEEIEEEEEEEDINNNDKESDILTNSKLADEIYNQKEIEIPKSKQEQTNPHSNSNINTYDKINNNDQSATNVQKGGNQQSGFSSNFVPKKQDIVKFDHVDLNNLKILDEDDITQNLTEEIDEEHLQRVGRKGEARICKYLKDLYCSDENISIKWLNETGETGLSYDIEINFIDKTQDIHRIEVKTTTKHDGNCQFSISIQEVGEILKYPDTYYIYRVNLNNRSLTIIKDIKSNLSDKQQLVLKLNVLSTNDLNETK